jgi:hypothetical protein
VNDQTTKTAEGIAAMLEAIETAGGVVGTVLDSPNMTSRERNLALSRAHVALGAAYFKATGEPLEWWRVGISPGLA